MYFNICDMIITNLQSKTISLLRFPLIIGVVLIHSRYKEVSVDSEMRAVEDIFPVYELLSYLISEIFARAAVPVFFFFSGFLFFEGTNFSLDIYKCKLKKRIRTIVIPYLFWNVLTIILFLLGQVCFRELFSGSNKLILDYSLYDWLTTFWNGYRGLYPICYQFWFIRDLMVVMLLSPIIFYLVKYFKTYSVLFLGIFWIFDIWIKVPGFSIIALFFFTFGGWYNICQRDFILDFKPLLWGIVPVYIVSVSCCLCLRENLYLHNINIILGVIFVIAFTSHLVEWKKYSINVTLCDSSFFIYAYHAIILGLLTKILFMIFTPHTDFMFIVLYFLCPLLVIVCGFYLYCALRKYLPNITKFITGGR